MRGTGCRGIRGPDSPNDQPSRPSLKTPKSAQPELVEGPAPTVDPGYGLAYLLHCNDASYYAGHIDAEIFGRIANF
jgi:hypothetical protein